jgi:hypothetical protein
MSSLKLFFSMVSNTVESPLEKKEMSLKIVSVTAL